MPARRLSCAAMAPACTRVMVQTAVPGCAASGQAATMSTSRLPRTRFTSGWRPALACRAISTIRGSSAEGTSLFTPLPS